MQYCMKYLLCTTCITVLHNAVTNDLYQYHDHFSWALHTTLNMLRIYACLAGFIFNLHTHHPTHMFTFTFLLYPYAHACITTYTHTHTHTHTHTRTHTPAVAAEANEDDDDDDDDEMDEEEGQGAWLSGQLLPVRGCGHQEWSTVLAHFHRIELKKTDHK